MKTFAICTLGCKVNTFESISISELLKSEGFKEVDFEENSDIYIIFTCAVTNTASSKSRKKINQAIRQNKDALICVVGCYVQLKPAELNDNEHIDILIGSSLKQNLPEYIKKALETKERINTIEDVRIKDVEFENLGVSYFDKQVRAYLKIQDGCNQFCSYCIIPYARGKERCMDYSNVVSMAKSISENHKEIVLAGIHTGRYTSDNVDLARLIQMILDECPNIERLRISSIEITEITDDLINIMKTNKRVAKHFHIPLQSGCNSVLKDMNRPYTTEYFFERINYIRNEINDVSISTDLIVGFPSETNEMFLETMDFLKRCELSFIHVFPFSSKEGTKASKTKSVVSALEKKQRVSEVGELSKKLYYSYKGKFIQKQLDVLIEKYEEGYSFGHSSEYIPVYIKGNYERNEIITVTGAYLKDDEFFGVKVDG